MQRTSPASRHPDQVRWQEAQGTVSNNIHSLSISPFPCPYQLIPPYLSPCTHTPGGYAAYARARPRAGGGQEHSRIKLLPGRIDARGKGSRRQGRQEVTKVNSLYRFFWEMSQLLSKFWEISQLLSKFWEISQFPNLTLSRKSTGTQSRGTTNVPRHV